MGQEAGERKYTRSISQYKSYTKCGQAFYLEKIIRRDMPVRPAAWTVLGIAFHEAVMQWEKTDRADPLDGWFDYYYKAERDALLEKQPDHDYWFLPPRVRTVERSLELYYERGIKMSKTYEERCENAPWELSHLEQEFEIDLDGVQVRGAVDRVLYYPGDDTYIIEDLKSGAIEGWEWDYRQLAFYAFVARELWKLPVNTGRYWFTKVDRASEEKDLTRFDKKFWAEEFKKLDVGIQSEIFLANPSKSCEVCAVRPWCNVQGWRQVGEPLKG